MQFFFVMDVDSYVGTAHQRINLDPAIPVRFIRFFIVVDVDNDVGTAHHRIEQG